MSLFSGLEHFIAVVEEGSVTGAARRLGLSKSFVSEKVKALEARLGVRLLDRTTRSLRLTEAGEAYYGRAVRAATEAESAVQEAQRFQAEPVGRLRVAVFESYHRIGLSEGLGSFLDANPSLQIEFVEGISTVDLVAGGMDLAIRVSPQPEPGLIVRQLGRSRVFPVAAPAYLDRCGPLTHPSQLAQHRLMAFAPLHYDREWRMTVEGRPMSVPVQPRVLTHSGESLRSMALAGVGVTALPEWTVADAIADGRLVHLMPDYPMAESGLYAVYPSNRLMTPKVKLFVEHIIPHLPAYITGAK
ncbi:MAG: hypothetical protein B7Y91_01490 [Rhodobacterales bacterium 32-64-14]|nr:MAG: hypothetical protein B7Y91_01490 [Rhodobacterales bacterium 32-64-14]